MQEVDVTLASLWAQSVQTYSRETDLKSSTDTLLNPGSPSRASSICKNNNDPDSKTGLSQCVSYSQEVTTNQLGKFIRFIRSTRQISPQQVAFRPFKLHKYFSTDLMTHLLIPQRKRTGFRPLHLSSSPSFFTLSNCLHFSLFHWEYNICLFSQDTSTQYFYGSYPKVNHIP